MILSFSLIMDSFWKTETLYFKGYIFMLEYKYVKKILFCTVTKHN